MKIPEVGGRMTVSVSQLRTYGAAGFDLDNFEGARGCPRQYKARYVDKTAPRQEADVLNYGTIIHRALELMETEPQTPEDALSKVWKVQMGADWWAEAVEDLRRYLERPASPLSNYAVIATEKHLTAELYVDPDFGPVDFQGYIDAVAVDYHTPNLLHVVDFKTNRQPPSVDDVRADAQGKGYSWLALQNAGQLVHGAAPEDIKVVFHLDAIKWRELPPIHFSAHDLDMWHGWMVAVVRAILRDEEAKPIINPGCAHCPVAASCPAYQALPDKAAALLRVKPDDRDELARWAVKVNDMRLLLEKAFKRANEDFSADASQLGEVVAGGQRWAPEVQWANAPDTRQLHRVLGDRFYDAVTVTKAGIERATAGDPTTAEAALECIRREPVGTKIRRSKEKP